MINREQKPDTHLVLRLQEFLCRSGSMTVDATVHSKHTLEMTGKCNQPKVIYDASVRRVFTTPCAANWRLSQAFCCRMHFADMIAGW